MTPKNTEPLAHSGGHLLAEHLRSVGKLAAEFARALGKDSGAVEWSYLAGLWHDLGKYRPGFQRYLALSNDANAHIEGRVPGRDKTHSIAGALWANQFFKKSHGKSGKLAARVLAYLIASHHTGLHYCNGGLRERLSAPACQAQFEGKCYVH